VSATDDNDDLRDLGFALAAREREYEETHGDWQRLIEQEEALKGNGVKWVAGRRVVRADGSVRDEGRSTVRVTVEIDGWTRYVDEIDEAERLLLLRDLAAERARCAPLLIEARRRLAEARRALGNAKLEAAVTRYQTVGEELSSARKQTEAALSQVFTRTIEYGRARDAARRAARRLQQIAGDAAHDSREIVEQLKDVAKNGDVPVKLTEHGVEVIDGPDFDLLADDPTEDAMWQAIASWKRLAVIDPQRAAAQLRETKLGRATRIN
jgi:hypothetical protein